MELARLTLPIPEVTVDFGDSDAFSLDDQNMGCPPSSAHSFSSASSSFGPYTPASGRSIPRTRSDAMGFCSFASSASSSLGPYTPTSERSTPPSSDLAGLTAFASSVDPFPFGLIAPSSALSTYFQVGVKTENSYDLFPPDDPSTQPQKQWDLSGLPYGPYCDQFTPSQPVSFYQFANELGPSPLPPSPLEPVRTGQNWDSCPIWAQPDTRISLAKCKGALPLLVDIDDQDDVALSLLTGPIGRHLFKPPKGQKDDKLNPTNPQKRGRGTKNLSTVVTQNGLQISKVPLRKFNCSRDGCEKKYERKEHLKRHVESHHLKAKHKCLYCDKIFNRTDNRRSHLQLHATERKAGRVEYMAGLEKILEEEMKRSKRRRTSNEVSHI